ncbi:MAG: nucleotidyl transferase AbiEii/AbiGii toxin family protein [Coprothermobacterota bacterium]|nr:nucleotidyl transferase AbiEii/AbiGii toxin family protein [Coprothermobacterota bacterium]
MTGKGLLSPLQRRILACLSQIPDLIQFYLTGGTALAEFYLGHRKSFDLDIFTGEEGLVQPFSRQAVGALRGSNIVVQVVRQFATFVELSCIEHDESTEVQFALDSPFHLNPPDNSEYGIQIASFADLATDKLLAFTGRMESRDAVDLFFLMKDANLEAFFAMAQQKDPGFDHYWFSMACAKVQEFPDELDRWPVEMLIPLDIGQLKAMFLGLGQDYLRDIKRANQSSG